IGRYNVQGFLFDGYWEDIGTIAAFYKANLDMTASIPPFNLFDAEAPLLSRARYLPPSKFDNCEIRDSIFSDGCIINGAKMNRSVIGLRSRIAEGAQLDSVYMMGADYYQTLEEMSTDITNNFPWIGIGANTIITRAIIDKNARIGSGVRLVNEAQALEADSPDGSYFIRDGIIIVPKNAVIKDGTIV
ncbi:MAG TPA: hypothetical protein VF961_04050, partial [Pyrinomonadaceae bacterium]